MKSWTALASELLPPRLQEFVRLIGLPATMLLVERFGGLRIYIPAAATVDHPFAELIGYDNLVKLAEQYGIDGTGDRFLLPRAERALNAVRNAQIRTDDVESKSLRELAIEHQLTERHVSRIVAGMQTSGDRQATLDL